MATQEAGGLLERLEALEALTQRVEAQEARIAGLEAENGRLRALTSPTTSAHPWSDRSPGPKARVGRRGVLRRVLGATAAAALLTVVKEAATAEAATRTTVLSGSGSTDDYGLLAISDFGGSPRDPLPFMPTLNGYSFGIIGTVGFPGIAAPTSAGVLGSGSGGAGVLGLNSDGSGVRGLSSTGHGVRGLSSTGHGVQGETAGFQAGVRGLGNSGGIGVWGDSGSRAGVFGTSTNSLGMFGVSSPSNPNGTAAPSTICGVAGQGVGRVGVLGLSDTTYGVQGQSTDGIGMNGTSTNNYGVVGATQKSGYAGLVGVGNQPGAAGFYALGVNGATAGTFQGDVVINGSLTVTGSFPKSAAVKKKDSTLARMYCVEAPESWFEDFGTATLANGQASVPLDPEFDEVVNGNDYRVFLTPIGAGCGSLYVAGKGPHQFEVRSERGATASGSFDYRVVARRLDNVGRRMEKVVVPTMAPIDVDRFTQPAAPPTTPHSGGR